MVYLKRKRAGREAAETGTGQYVHLAVQDQGLLGSDEGAKADRDRGGTDGFARTLGHL